MSEPAPDYLWSLPSPARLTRAAVPAIVDWCRARRVERPMLVGGHSLTAAPRGLALVHGLEAAGLAVWAFDRVAVPSLAAVAEAVAAYQFEGCDAMLSIGSGAAAEVAKAAALMTGQRNPYRALAPDPGDAAEPLDLSALPPLLAVPATPLAAASACGALWIADEAGVARPLRHPALRPTEAILADDLIEAVPPDVAARSAALLALLAVDAGADDSAAVALLSAADRGAAMRVAVRLAAVVEAGSSPRRRLALTAAATAGLDVAATMLALTAPAGWVDAARSRLGTGPAAVPAAALLSAARSLCGTADRAAVDAVLAGLGMAIEEMPRRRGGRGGAGRHRP